MLSPRSSFIGLAAIVLCWTLAIALYAGVKPQRWRNEIQPEDYSATEQFACRWLSLCGISNVDGDKALDLRHVKKDQKPMLDTDIESMLLEDRIVPDSWLGADPAIAYGQKKELKDIPQYVLDYAPLVHLHSEEPYWPSDIGEHLKHTYPTNQYTPIMGVPKPTVGNLHNLNSEDGNLGWSVYLASKDKIETNPAWLTSEYGIPKVANDSTAAEDDTTTGGRSAAPVVLVIVEKENGILDAFWFFFYSYNLGNGIFGIRFGNHVGDWEHTVVRFIDGVPKQMFVSEHAGGASYTFEAMEKYGIRPVVYSAVGTHAMYAAPGKHPYVLPFGILKDQANKGPLWDPVLNMYSYHYNTSLAHGGDLGVRKLLSHTTEVSTLAPTAKTPTAPTSFFYFTGHWGDKYFPLSDPRQYRFFSEWAHVSGPPGPRFKALGRPNICFELDADACNVKDSIAPLHWILMLLKDLLIVFAIFWLVAGVIFLVVWIFRRGCGSCCFALRRQTRKKEVVAVDESRPLLDDDNGRSSPQHGEVDDPL